jgi:uncharacterized protein YecE (DUF72 family)
MFGGPALSLFKRLSNRIRYHILFSVTYSGRYDKQTLSGWAGAFSSWKRQGKDIFCYFNNDAQGHAVRNALELKQMLEP